MNTNKQLNKGNNMKKAILSLLVVLSMSAAISTPSQAGYWTHSNNYYGGTTSTYTPTYNSLMGGWF